MLQMISWKDFATLIGLVTVLYYSYILIKYFPREIRGLVRVPSAGQGQNEYEEDEDEPGKPVPTDGQDLTAIAQELSAQIKMMVAKAAKQKMIKEEIIWALELLLRTDRAQRLRENVVLEESINRLILFEFENNCSIRFDALEMGGLWVR